MIRHLLVFITFFLPAFQSSASYSGTYTVGNSGYFTLIQQAFDSLNAYGISSPVQLEIESGNYTGHFIIGPVLGNDLNNTITIRSAGQNLNLVIINGSPQSGEIFKVQNAFVVFEDLSIFNNGITTNDAGVTNKSGHIVIRRCDIGSTASNPPLVKSAHNTNYNYLELDHCNLIGGTGVFEGKPGDSLYISDCEIGGQSSYFFYANSLNVLSVKNSIITSSPGSGSHYIFDPISVVFENNTLNTSFHMRDARDVLFRNNNIKANRWFSFEADNVQILENFGDGEIRSSTAQYVEINRNTFTGDCYIESIVLNSDGNTGTRHVYRNESGTIKNNTIPILSTTGTNNTSIVENNIVSNTLNLSTHSDTLIIRRNQIQRLSGYPRYGIFEENKIDYAYFFPFFCRMERNEFNTLSIQIGREIQLYNNWIRDVFAVGFTSAVILHNNSTANVTLVGNFCKFYNNNLPGPILGNVDTLISDYNNYYPNAVSTELHSISIDPMYTSLTDLHSNNQLLSSAGYPYSTVHFDKDNYLRPNPPSIGAHETSAIILNDQQDIPGEENLFPSISDGKFKLISKNRKVWTITSSTDAEIISGKIDSDEKQFDLNLTPGIYFMNLDGVRTFKFIIQKY
ncbi:MAG: hypothetical protein ACO1G9_13500 [Bacteroidota bacterium]